jgi:hypothetical protein
MKKSKEQKHQNKLFKLHKKYGNVMSLLKEHPLSLEEIKMFLDYEHAETLTITELLDYI